MSRNENGCYSKEFREKAVALAEEIGAKHAAPKLGVARHTLRMWVWLKQKGRQMRKDEPPESKALLLAERKIRELEKEIQDLKKANLVLKEVAQVFSKDHPKSNLGWSLNSTKKSKLK